jgi:hypothetical protein
MRLQRFLGEMSAFDGEGDINTASVCYNGRIEDTRFRPRYGYRTIALPPASFETCHLFEFVSGYRVVESKYTPITEILSIEKVSGVVKPYAVNPTTGVRTEILNGATALSLPDMEHVCAVFGEYVYIVCPGVLGTGTRVWRHKILDNTSYEVVQNTAYIAPPIDSAISIPPQTTAYTPYEFLSGDTVTATGDIGGINWATVNGTIVVKGSTLTGVNALNHRVEVTFASTQNWANRAYIGLEILGGSNTNWFTLSQKLELRIGGVWVEVETYPQIGSTGANILIAGYIKGLTLTAVQGIRARFLAGSFADNQPTTATAYTVGKLKLGGNLLEASVGTLRAWTADPGDGIQYAARYKHSSGTPVPTTISQTTLTPEGAKGVAIASYNDLVLGGRPVLTVLAANTGTYDQVQFLRQMQDGVTWKEIGVVANTGTSVTFADFYEENEMSARPTVTITGGGTNTATPPFSGDGMTAVFPAFGRMVWGRGTSVDYSYAGNPLSLYSMDAPTESPRDGRQAVQWTLADNFADEVVTGTAAGRVGTIIFGKKATYAQNGTIPVTMTPPGEIQGSRGIAGRKAFDAYMTPDGNEGVVSVDPTGGVWFVPYSSITTNNGQGDARVIEMSRGNPHTIWEWLVEGQQAEFGYTSLELVKVVFCKDTGELRISLGKRAIVLDTINGDMSPQWTRHQYALTVPDGETSESSCTGFENLGATATSVAPGDVGWIDRGNAFSSDDSYATAAFGYGTAQATETLRVVSISPDNAIPIGATIDSQTLRLEIGKTGDLSATISVIQPKNNGANLGANLGTGQVLTTTDQILDFALASMASVADINAGYMQVDVKCVQETWESAWHNTANYTVVASSSGGSTIVYNGVTTSATFASATNTVSWNHVADQSVTDDYEPKVETSGNAIFTITWTGGGTVPTKAFVSVNSAVSADHSFESGTISGSNGNGNTFTLSAYNAGSSSGIKVYPVTLVAGVGTLTIPVEALSSGGYRSWVSQEECTFETTGAVTATIATPTPATVRVDNVAFKTCYTIGAVSPGVDSGVAWVGVSWLDPNKLWAIRSTGNIDELRFNTVTRQWIDGDGRDGGYSMPAPYWESQYIRPSQASLLAWVYVEKATPNETIVVKGQTDRGGYVTARSLRDSYKFSVTQQGKSHKLRFELDETSAGLKAATLGFKPLSNQYTR